MYKRNNQGWLKHIDFIILDVIVLQVAFWLAYFLRHGRNNFYDQYRSFIIMYTMVDILVTIAFNTMSGVLRRGYYREFVSGMKQVALDLVIMTLFLFTIKNGEVFSRIIIYLTALFHLIIGYPLRLIWKKIILRFGTPRKKSPMILVADETKIPEIMNNVSRVDSIEFAGLVLTNRDATGETIDGIKVVSSLESAADFICREWVDEVFIYPNKLTDIEVQRRNLDSSIEQIIDDYSNSTENDDLVDMADEKEEATVASLIEQCRQMSVPVHIRLPLSNIGKKSFVEKVGGYNVLTTTSNYASPLQLAAKRTMDILGGIIGSILSLIIMAIVGPKIKKESPGPILFTQTRVGKNGKRFKIYKIRSMYMDAEEHKKEFIEQNNVSDGMMFKLDFDPRIIGNKIVDGKQVTGIGQFIRNYSLDEFPQFFNVLLDQMSLVGTRPPTVDEWDKYKYHHRARLSTKPGITGLWQVSGRSKITDFEEVVKLDAEYIDHWSIGLDIRILLRTVKVVLKREGAK